MSVTGSTSFDSITPSLPLADRKSSLSPLFLSPFFNGLSQSTFPNASPFSFFSLNYYVIIFYLSPKSLLSLWITTTTTHPHTLKPNSLCWKAPEVCQPVLLSNTLSHGQGRSSWLLLRLNTRAKIGHIWGKHECDCFTDSWSKVSASLTPGYRSHRKCSWGKSLENTNCCRVASIPCILLSAALGSQRGMCETPTGTLERSPRGRKLPQRVVWESDLRT